MKHPRILAHGWLLAFSALVLVACGGDGGGIGEIANTAPTPASSQGAVQELSNTFAANLTGTQAVPSQLSAANGSGTVVIDPGTLRMNAVLATSGISGASANIQQAPRGAVGPIVFQLVETAPGSGIWTGSATLTDAQRNAFASGEFYFNVSSAASASGEIRGQILAQPLPAASLAGSSQNAAISTTSFISTLRGTQEVPPNGSTAIGAGSLLIDPASRQLSAVVATTGIAGIAAHVHQAPPGVNGPIIVPLAETGPGTRIWTAKVALTGEQFAALQAGNMYVNVYSTSLPDGEVRGQLIAQQLLPSGVTGGGTTPAAPAAGIPVAGAPASLPSAPDMNRISDNQPDSASLAM
jgi:hypothetical protein